VKAATEATVKAPLNAKLRAQLRRAGRAKVTVTVSFAPRKGRSITLRKTITAHR
jgi:hypothetical protein